MGIRVCRPHLNSVIQFICRVSSKVVFLSTSHHFTDRLNSLAARRTLLTLYSQHTPICIYLLLQESASLFPARHGSRPRTHFPTTHTQSTPSSRLCTRTTTAVRPLTTHQGFGSMSRLRRSLNTFTPHFSGHRPFVCSHQTRCSWR